ncbi:MAG: hypothetical protein LQ341_002118 [Variospora aurantia]|nr:MAG: hypothetical protein LQ341_002118 [Variospora aurantia]
MRLVDLLPVLCLLFRPLTATFADDAYHIDFHHVLLGIPQPRATFLHRPSATSKASLLYTLSNRSVLGAVNPRDGSVVWRQQLGAGNGLLRPVFGESIIISVVNRTVQAWDAAEGRLVWDWTSPDEITNLEISQYGGGGQGIYILTQGEGAKATVRKLSEHSGVLEWEYHDESGNISHGLSISAQGLYFVASHSAILQGSKIKVTTLNPSDGISLGVIHLSTDADLSDDDSMLTLESTGFSSLVIWSDRNLKSLRINVLGTNNIYVARLPIEKDEPIGTVQISTSATKGGAVDLLVHCKFRASDTTSHSAHLYHFDAVSESLKTVYHLPSVQGPAAFSIAIHDGNTYLVRTTKRDVTLFSSISEHHLEQWLLQPKFHSPSTSAYDIPFAVSEVVVREKSSYGVRSAVLHSSGDWEMIQNGENIWFRPESLSGVVAAAWAGTDGPRSPTRELKTESHSHIAAAYLHRIKRHARDSKSFPQWIQGIPDRIAHSLFGIEYRSQTTGFERDSFGFHKILILATDSGRVFALDAGSNGKILWSTQVSLIGKGPLWEVESIQVDSDIALIRDFGGLELQVRVTDGIILDNQLSTAEVDLKKTITVPDMSGSALTIKVKADGTVAVPQRRHSGLEMMIVTRDDNMAIRGWTLATSEPVLAWAFLPRPNERVISIAARPLSDPVASIGKALGDRNVLYKFLSPNLLIIGAVKVDTSSASFYILDSISGRVLRTLTHPGVDITQPINCVLSENWFAYTVFSNLTERVAQNGAVTQAATKGYQIVVSELYESTLANDRNPLDPASSPPNLHPRAVDASVHDNGPHMVSQTYLVPAAVSFMTVTSTSQGITPRSLLCVVPSLNSVFAIPRAYIDPRRPTERDATSMEAEEGLFRHEAALEFDPKWALNHMREVQGVQTVITSPSLLESTSLVFAFGNLDLFGTRIAPIGGFDMLGKGFNKIQLIGTVVALAIGTGVLAPLVRKKQTDSRWKGT